MAKQVLNKSTPSNRVDHVDQRNKINANFTELYEGKVDKEAGKSLVSTAEKANWNGKQDPLTLKTVNGESIVGTGNIEVSGSVPDATLEVAGKVKVRGGSGTGAPIVYSTEFSDSIFVSKEDGKSLVTDAERTQWNGASIGSDLGLLKTTDTPPPTGTHKGDVNSAGTYTNFKTAAAVSIVFTAPELVDNFGFIYVVDNVATKSLVAKKGGSGKIEEWISQTYAINSQTSYLGKFWKNKEATSSSDIPGTSTKWIEDLYAYVSKDTLFNKSKNLYNGNVILGKNIANTTPFDISDVAGVKAKITVLEIENGASYTVTKYRGGFGFRIITVNTYPEKGTASIPSLYNYIDSTNPKTEVSHSFTNTANAKYLVLQYQINTSDEVDPLIQIEKNSVQTRYESFGLKNKDVVFNEYLERITTNEVPNKKFIGAVLKTNGISLEANGVFYRVPLYGNEKILIKNIGGEGDRFSLYFRSLPMEYGVEGLPKPFSVFKDSGIVIFPATEYLFENNTSAVEMWVYANAASEPQIVNYSFEYINQAPIDNNIPKTIIGSKKDFVLVADKLSAKGSLEVNKTLEKRLLRFNTQHFDLYETSTTEIPTLGESIQLLDYYSLFDAFVSAKPDYVTKTVIGVDSVGNNMNLYKFSPVRTRGMEAKKLLKIALISCQHGSEKAGGFGDYNLLKKMVNNWQSNKFLEYLRFNVELYVIPVVNTSNFNAGIRENINGKNLNRDYPKTANGVLTGRELETQSVMNFILANKDLDFVLDHHTDSLLPVADDYGYIHTSNVNLQQSFSDASTKISKKWQNTYPTLNQNENLVLGSVRPFPKETLLINWLDLLNIKCAVIENQNLGKAEPTTGQTAQQASLIMNEELLANFLQESINYIIQG